LTEERGEEGTEGVEDEEAEVLMEGVLLTYGRNI